MAALISIKFSIKAGGDLLFLGLFETPSALAHIQMLKDNGAYAVVTSTVGYECEECEDKGITNDGIDDGYCACELGEIMKRADEIRRENREARKMFASDSAIASVTFVSGREVKRTEV